MAEIITIVLLVMFQKDRIREAFDAFGRMILRWRRNLVSYGLSSQILAIDSAGTISFS